jgi:hypothetical protein
MVTCTRQRFTAIPIMFSPADMQMRFMIKGRESRNEVLAKKANRRKGGLR